jgi:phosphoadenosine phosphosulfate reductase
MPVAASEIVDAQKRLAGASPEDIVAWALQRFGDQIAIASSFSIEDCVVIDIATRIDANVKVFALDTGRLPEATYVTADRVRDKYRVAIAWQFPERAAVEALERDKGLFSFMESLDNRHECCGIRKVAPLGRALAGVAAWMTGLRRDQSITRTDSVEVELDGAHGGIAKVNPLISWTEEQVRAYATAHRVPINALHNQGYPSIGCAPCTRAVEPGEHPRAGRWWWENPDSKECGLHPVATPIVRAK